MGKDFKALHPWSEEDLERLATKARREAGYRDNELTFCAWECLKRLPFTRNVPVKHFGLGEHPVPAFVQFDPLELHIAREVRNDTEQQDGTARLIVLHEAAHVRLHNNGKRSFSPFGAHDETRNIKEWSVEWQANTWAGYFLLPDTIVSLFETVEQIVEFCDVDLLTATVRFEQFKDRQRRRSAFTLCFGCGQPKVRVASRALTCPTCGDLT